jgi:CheY-like chemotaxis protein
MATMVQGRKATALVVDDEADLVDLMGRVLQSTGIDVMGALGGQDALQHLSQHAYDLVVLDIKMPGVSGTEVFATIRASYPRLIQRTILTTGDVVSVQTTQWLESTGCLVLEKPFDMDQFVNAVEVALQRRDV